MGPGVVVHAVIQNQEGAWVEFGDPPRILFLHNLLHYELLPLDEIGQNNSIVLTVNEDRWNHLLEEAV
jgi:hypothetical protein